MNNSMVTNSMVTGAQKRAFTLIELLVVIAIIAILAAILFPVFATAREKARQTSCASNMKQMGLAVMQYVEDYDEALPAAVDLGDEYNYWVDGSPGANNWILKIMPYVKSTGVFECPDDSLAGSSSWAGTEISYAANALVSYGIGPNFGAATLVGVFAWGGATSWSPAMQSDNPTLAVVTSPSTTIAIYEAHSQDAANWSAFGASQGFSGLTWLGADTQLPATCTPYTSTFPNTVNCGVSASHTGMANFLYLDGHVKTLYPTKTVDPAGAGNLDSLNQWYAQQ